VKAVKKKLLKMAEGVHFPGSVPVSQEADGPALASGV
jgi:hypothetical protein